jgi:hypothetical protein
MKFMASCLWISAACLLLAACNGSAPKGDFESGVPDVYFYQIDKAVPPETAQKVLLQVLNTVPQLKTIRAKQEQAARDKVRLNLSLQSGPDPKAFQELERSYYYVYVNTRGEKLISTYTFVVKKDFSDVKVFDKSGDVVISVAQWLAEQAGETLPK